MPLKKVIKNSKDDKKLRDKIINKLVNRPKIQDNPCYRGAEIYKAIVPVKKQDVGTLELYFCGGLALAYTFLTHTDGTQKKIAEAYVDDQGVSIQIPLSTLNSGQWVLSWTWHHEAADHWLMTSQVIVNNAITFRLYKSNPGNSPTNTLWLILEVS